MSVRLPELLDSTLAEKARLHPTALSVTLSLTGAGQATMTLAEDDPEVKVHDLVRIYTQRGAAGIFRVTNVARSYTQQTDVTLLHAIDLLSDSVWAAQTDFSGTMTEYLTALLAQQTALINGVKPWTLGTCDDTGTVEQKINYNRLSELLEDLEKPGSACRFVYDQSVWPWTVSWVSLSASVATEFRLDRNVETASVTYNDADLCTRLHLSASQHIAASTTGHTTTGGETKTVLKTYNNTAAQAVWGIVVKTADIDVTDDVDSGVTPEADAWAADYLAKRAAPTVQIQVDGEELSSLTGETWDEVSLGRVARVALPAYSTTLEERVVQVTYPDALGQPTRVTVSLANTLPQVSENIASLTRAEAKTAKAARGLGRSKADEKDQVVWNQVVRWQGAALDGTGVTTLYESGIDMDATGGVTVYSLQQGLQALYSGIQVNAHNITLKVSSGQVATQLEIECGNVSISGGDLIVDGMITANDLTTMDVTTASLTTDELTVGDVTIDSSGAISCTSIDINGYTEGDIGDAVTGFGAASVSSGQINIPFYTVDSPSPTAAGNITLDNSISELQITSSGNTYTLQYKMHGDAAWSNVGSFSRATTLSGAWSGRNFTVTASPQGDIKVGTVYDGIVGTGSVTVSGKNVTRTQIVYSEDPDTGDADAVILQKPVTIDASDVYDAGVNSVGLTTQAPSGSTLANQVKVSTSSSTKTLTVTAGLETSGTITVGTQSYTLGYESSSHKYLIAGTAMIGGGSPVSYSTGRTGTEAYDAGVQDGEAKFTQATVTLQGSAHAAITPISGAGVVPTKQVVNRRNTTALRLAYFGNQTLYAAPTGGAPSYTHTWYYVVPSTNTSGTNYYTAASDGTYYDVGSLYAGVTLYQAGSQITGLRNAGTTDSTTYYTKT